jgi:hypothetical protein
MGRIYAVPYTGTITNAGGNTDLIEILPADDKPCKLRGWSIGQTSEVADAAEEGLRITVRRLAATVTSGSGGSAVTPTLRDSADAAAGFAAECNNTTVATTSGADTILEEHSWINRNTPWEFWYPDERFCPKVKQGEALCVRLESTVADDMTGALTFFVEEE